MTKFEDILGQSARRLADQDNASLRVPDLPAGRKRPYWGWIAAPAAAVAGIVLGMSLHLLADRQPEVHIVHTTDTVRIDHHFLDTVYLTHVVEKVVEAKNAHSIARNQSSSPSEEDTTACTSVQCDGINYASLALN